MIRKSDSAGDFLAAHLAPAAGGVSASVTSRIFVGDRRRLVSSEAWVEAKRLVAADIGLSSLQSFFVSLLSRFALRSECLSPELRGFIAKDLRASSSAGPLPAWMKARR